MAEALISGFSEEVQVTRPEPGSYVNGVWTPAPDPELFTIRMSVQPANGKDLVILPEGERTRHIVKGYTTTELRTADETTRRRADRVAYNGTTFEVQNVQRWRGDLNFFKILLVEENR